MRNKAVIPANSLQAALQTTSPAPGPGCVGCCHCHPIGEAEPPLPWGHNVMFPQHPVFLLLSMVSVGICRAGIANLS